jgi:hypothetical protein
MRDKDFSHLQLVFYLFSSINETNIGNGAAGRRSIARFLPGINHGLQVSRAARAGPVSLFVTPDPTRQGEFMSERVNLGKSAPALYQVISGLEKLAGKAVASAGIPDGFAHLLRLRASQLNQCILHQDAYSRCPIQGRIERSHKCPGSLAGNRLFQRKECSSLALVEAITLISHGQVPVIHEVIEGAFTVPDDFEAINGQLDGMKALNLKGGEQAGFARLPNPLPNTLHQNA